MVLAKKYFIDNILSSLNINFQKSNLLNLVNLDGEKTIYTSTESTPFLLSLIVNQINDQIFVVVENNEIAKKIFQDCQSFLGPNYPIFYIPEIETHPMSGLEKNSISLAERNDALSRVIELNGKPSLIFLSAFSLAQKIPEKKYFYNTLLDLKVGQNLEISKLINNLIKYGYKRTHTVENLGEFSVRGSLIDIFSAGQELPIRVDFYEDFIDGIRVFDPVTQRTVGRQNNLIIRAIDYQNINNISEGSITDLIGNSSCFVQINPKSSGHLVNQYKQRYTQKGIDDFLFDWKEINISLKKFKNKIAVALDVRNGFIALRGWKDQTKIMASDFLMKIKDIGVSRIIYSCLSAISWRKFKRIGARSGW